MTVGRAFMEVQHIKKSFHKQQLSAFIPSMLISVISVILFGILVNPLTFDMFPSLLFPNRNWLVLVLWVSPALSLLTILINVLISARVQSFQAAQQLGGTVVYLLCCCLLDRHPVFC